MNEIERLIRIAGRRWRLARFLETLVIGTEFALAALIIWVLVAKSVPAVLLPIWIPLTIAGLVVIGLAGTLAWRSHRDPVAVAVAIDTRLELRDRISTAWQVRRRDDPFAMAAVADASRIAAGPELRKRVSVAFRPATPHGWWVAPVLGLALLGIWTIVPGTDLFAASVENAGQREIDQAR